LDEFADSLLQYISSLPLLEKPNVLPLLMFSCLPDFKFSNEIPVGFLAANQFELEKEPLYPLGKVYVLFEEVLFTINVSF
jgi:hypothetical protein